MLTDLLLRRYCLISKRSEGKSCRKREMLRDMVRDKQTQHVTRLSLAAHLFLLPLSAAVAMLWAQPGFMPLGPTADCCCPKHQPHCQTAGMATSPPTERHQPGTNVCHLPPETGGDPCPNALHCSPGLSQVFNGGRRRMEKSLSHSGEAVAPYGSQGCFPLEERRTRVTICRQQPQVSGIKLPSKTPGPRKTLISGL